MLAALVAIALVAAVVAEQSPGRRLDPAPWWRCWSPIAAVVAEPTTESASAALLALDDLRRAVGRRSAVPSGEIWTDG